MIFEQISKLKKKDTIINFDMDGVLVDWIAGYNDRYGDIMSINEFANLDEHMCHIIQENIFDYDFFFSMQPINDSISLLKKLKKEGYNIEILSAVGNTTKSKDIERAKIDWIKKYVSKDLKCKFVDKVENKYKMIDCSYKHNVLIDDMSSAIHYWSMNGGIGIIFKQ